LGENLLIKLRNDYKELSSVDQLIEITGKKKERMGIVNRATKSWSNHRSKLNFGYI
jgi:hypothetical protein